MGIMISYQEDIVVSMQLDIHEREACNMHYGDKLLQAATVKIILSKNKRVVNPFPSVVTLVDISTKVAKHFSYVTHIKNIHKICGITDSHIINPKFDKNLTFVA